MHGAVTAAVEIAAQVRDGRSCAVDVARAHLARTAGHPGFHPHDAERVLAEAGAVDARADRFALPLAGVPVAVAAELVAGGVDDSGRPVRRGHELVRRLRAAGAVIVGTETGSRSDPGLAGGAAVAAGRAAIAVGAAGVDPVAGSELVGLRCGSGGPGPIARTAADAALMLQVLTGQAVPLDGPGPTRVALSLPRPSLFGRLHPDQRAAAVGAAARLRAGPGGAEVTLADPPAARAGRAFRSSRWRARTNARPHDDRRDHTVAWLDTGRYDLLLTPAVRTDRGPGLAGLPVVAAPVLVDDRPTGVLLVGRPGAEAALLAAAARLERRVVPALGAAKPRVYV